MPQIIAAVPVYYPRSFLKFILLGFLLVSLPLLYALGELILSLDQLQTQGREAVQQAAQAGRASRSPMADATAAVPSGRLSHRIGGNAPLPLHVASGGSAQIIEVVDMEEIAAEIFGSVGISQLHDFGHQM